MPKTRTPLMLVAAGIGMLLTVQPSQAQLRPHLATKASNSVVVVFNSQSLPVDAAVRVQNAGGTVTATLPSVGVLTAAPTTADGASFLRNLRKDQAVQDADFDVMLDLIAPAQTAAEPAAVSPDTHFPHPLPTFSPALPADFFYTSSPQQWSVKRVGAQGGRHPGRRAGRLGHNERCGRQDRHSRYWGKPGSSGRGVPADFQCGSYFL